MEVQADLLFFYDARRDGSAHVSKVTLLMSVSRYNIHV